MIDKKLEELKTLQEVMERLNNNITQLIQAIESDSLKKAIECYENMIYPDDEDTYSFEDDVIDRVQHIMNSNY